MQKYMSKLPFSSEFILNWGMEWLIMCIIDIPLSLTFVVGKISGELTLFQLYESLGLSQPAEGCQLVTLL